MYNTKNYTEQGGEKTLIGGTLEILEGASLIVDGSNVSLIENQSNSTGTTVADLKSDLNSLLEKLVAAGLMRAGE